MATGSFSSSHPTNGTADVFNGGQIVGSQMLANVIATLNGLVQQSSANSFYGVARQCTVKGLTIDGVGAVAVSPISGLSVTGGGITSSSGLTVTSGGAAITGTLAMHSGSSITLATGSYVYGIGSGVSFNPGTGAGTGPTISVLGSDTGGQITVTPGTTPATSATIVQAVFSGTIPTAGTTVGPIILITPANAAAATLSGTAQVVAALTTGGGNYTGFNLVSGSAALTNGTQYKWNWGMPCVV